MDPAPKSKRIRAQCIALCSCMFSMMSAGNVLGWMSPAMVIVKLSSDNIPVTLDDLMFVSSMAYVGIIVGPVVFALIVDKTGRKWINFFSSCIYMAGWALSIFANTSGLIIASRIVLGIAMGFSFCIVPVYIGEVIENRLKAAFSAGLVSMLLVGFLYIYVLAPFVNFRVLSIISLFFPIASLMTFFFMPESPQLHIMRNKLREAESSLMRLRGETNRMNIIEEFAEMVELLEDGFTIQPITRKFKLLQLRKSTFPLLIIACLIFTQCFSGVFPLMGHIHVVVKNDESVMNDFFEVIVATLIAFIVSMWTAYLINHIGRRILFMLSSLGCCLATTVMGVYYFCDVANIDNGRYSWVMVGSVFSFQLFFHSGLGCIPYAFGCEVFPPFVKPWTTAFMVMMLGIFGFLSSFLYVVLGTNFGYHVSFWMFAGSQLLGAVFIYCYMPETRKKTYAEILRKFNLNHDNPKSKPLATNAVSVSVIG